MQNWKQDSCRVGSRTGACLEAELLQNWKQNWCRIGSRISHLSLLLPHGWLSLLQPGITLLACHQYSSHGTEPAAQARANRAKTREFHGREKNMPKTLLLHSRVCCTLGELTAGTFHSLSPLAKWTLFSVLIRMLVLKDFYQEW